jgi:hypothetical protein
VVDLVASAFDLERGPFHTAAELIRRPGVTVRAYLSGRTVRYTNPVKYFVIGVTLAQIAAWRAGLINEFVDGLFEGGRNAAEVAPVAVQFLNNYFVVILALGLPLLALSTRLAFRGAGLNLAENLIFNLFLVGQNALVFAIYTPIIRILPPAVGYTTAAAAIVAQTGYYCWAATRFFRVGRVSGPFRAIAALLLSILPYTVLAAVVSPFLVRGLLNT